LPQLRARLPVIRLCQRRAGHLEDLAAVELVLVLVGALEG
jgi:hypothetical protein